MDVLRNQERFENEFISNLKRELRKKMFHFNRALFVLSHLRTVSKEYESIKWKSESYDVLYPTLPDLHSKRLELVKVKLSLEESQLDCSRNVKLFEETLIQLLHTFESVKNKTMYETLQKEYDSDMKNLYNGMIRATKINNFLDLFEYEEIKGDFHYNYPNRILYGESYFLSKIKKKKVFTNMYKSILSPIDYDSKEYKQYEDKKYKYALIELFKHNVDSIHKIRLDLESIKYR